MKKNILTVVGARPQLVKSSMVSMAFKKSNLFEEIFVHTGQHYDQNMSDIFFTDMGLSIPHHQLNIGSGTHGDQTGKMLAALEKIMIHEKPDCVLVYGDTNSTLAGALAAAKLHIPIAHVEAGLRSFNRKMPEEINRVVTDHVSQYLYAPTDLAVEHLQREGKKLDDVIQVGDVMFDMFIYFSELSDNRSSVLSKQQLKQKKYILATIHRAENTDDENRLRHIVGAFIEVSRQFLPVVLPLHPRTKNYLERYDLLSDVHHHLVAIEPVGLLDMLNLEKNAALLVTDSGGVQKEAYFAGVPCVTLRDETEWQELIDLCWNRLAPPISMANVVKKVEEALGTTGVSNVFPYGKGNASALIANHLSGVL